MLPVTIMSERTKVGNSCVLFDAQDDIDPHREQLIAEIEGKLQERERPSKRLKQCFPALEDDTVA